MGFLVACKNEEDPIKIEGARVVTTSIIEFSDAFSSIQTKQLFIEFTILYSLHDQPRDKLKSHDCRKWNPYFYN